MRYLVPWLLFLTSNCLSAQAFQASILAGGNLSQVDGDDLLGFHRAGFNGGIRVLALLSERWRLGPEILFSQQGAKRNKNSLNISDFRAFDLSTVEIPVMIYYKDWRITAEAGVSYQRLIDYAVFDARDQDITATTKLKSDLAAINFGATLYLTPRIGVTFRWSKHLTDLQLAEDPRLRGRTITLRAVYTLGRGEILPPSTSEPQ